MFLFYIIVCKLLKSDMVHKTVIVIIHIESAMIKQIIYITL